MLCRHSVFSFGKSYFSFKSVSKNLTEYCLRINNVFSGNAVIEVTNTEMLSLFDDTGIKFTKFIYVNVVVQK